MADRKPEDIIRIGVAGLGFGVGVHVPALRQIPNVEIVVLAGRDIARTTEIAKRLKIPNACAPAVDMLSYDLDAVSLALPPNQIEAIAIPALEKGLGVLCEKPIAHNLEVARRIAEAACDRTTIVDFQFSELAVFQELRNIIADERLGRVRHANVTWLTQSWAQKQQTWSWKTDRKQAGGAITLFGTHLMYLAEWLFGPVQKVSARFDYSVTDGFAPAPASSAEELVHLLMEHDSGAPFSATFGNANPGLSVHRWYVVFEQGSVCLENLGKDYMAGFKLTVTGTDGKEMTSITEPQVEGDGRLPPFRKLAARFVESLRKHQPCEPGLEKGVRIQQLMDAAVRSAQKNNGQFERI